MHNVALFTIRQHLLSRWLGRCPYRCSGRLFGTSFDRPKLSLLVGPFGSQVQHRGAKSRATVQLDELPNSSTESCIGLPEQENAGPAYPTVVQQALNNMRRYENCVLLTRVGSFYEVGTNLKRSHIIADLRGSFTSIKRTNMGLFSISRLPKRRLQLAQCPW